MKYLYDIFYISYYCLLHFRAMIDTLSPPHPRLFVIKIYRTLLFHYKVFLLFIWLHGHCSKIATAISFQIMDYCLRNWLWVQFNVDGNLQENETGPKMFKNAASTLLRRAKIQSHKLTSTLRYSCKLNYNHLNTILITSVYTPLLTTPLTDIPHLLRPYSYLNILGVYCWLDYITTGQTPTPGHELPNRLPSKIPKPQSSKKNCTLQFSLAITYGFK